MGTTEWLVLVGGIAAIAWVNWYFFLTEGSSAAAESGSSGVQEMRIDVAGGYSPSTVEVERGVPVRLVFDRRETSSCSEELVMGDFGIRRFLPAHEETVVEFTPDRAGTFEFTCGMGMLRGKVVVR